MNLYITEFSSTTEGMQKFPNTITFFFKSLKLSQFLINLYNLWLVWLLKMCSTLYKNFIQIGHELKRLQGFKKKCKQIENIYFLHAISLIDCWYEFEQRSHEQEPYSDASILVRNVP